MIVQELRSYLQHFDGNMPVILVVENGARDPHVLDPGGLVAVDALDLVLPLAAEGKRKLVVRGQYRGATGP